jgi:hypothetical protein
MYERALLLEFGGFDGRTFVGADSELNWRLLRFMSIGNIPHVLYSRRIHRDSLTQRPETGHRSPLRLAYFAEAARAHDEIEAVLRSGQPRRAKELATTDLYHGDVAVAEMHSGFDV